MTVGNKNASMQPTFVGGICPDDNCVEGEAFYLMVQLEPMHDESLSVEWHKDGKPIACSSRYGSTYERGYAAIQFTSLEVEDSGDYQCVAKNKIGSATSEPFNLKVECSHEDTHGEHIRSEQLSKSLAILENEVQKASKRETESHSTEAPVFTKNLEGDIHVMETEPIMLECRVEPSKDASLHVQWLKDDKDLSASNRVNKTYERGQAILTINYSEPTHSGIYKCVATNSNARVESSAIIIKVEGDKSIITSSNLSDDSVAFLKSLDTCDDLPSYGVIQEVQEMQAPSFIVKPKSLETVEKASARFLVKVEGYPVPTIDWTIDGQPIVQDSQLRIYNDGPISVLDIQRCELSHSADISVVARNSQGEASANATLLVSEPGDFRPDLKHITPENPFKKLSTLKKVNRTDELVNKLKKPKPTADDLTKLEQLSMNKGRTLADMEAIQVENVYKQVQQGLRSKGHM